MRKIDTDDGKFHKNVPGTLQTANEPKDWWINDIQKEIVNVITNLGKLEPNENDNTQFAQAIDTFLKAPMPVHVIHVSGQNPNLCPTGLSLAADGGYFYIYSGVCEVQQENCVPIPFRFVAYKVPESTSWRSTFQPFLKGRSLPIVLSISESGEVQMRTTADWPAGVLGLVHLVLNKREKV